MNDPATLLFAFLLVLLIFGVAILITVVAVRRPVSSIASELETERQRRRQAEQRVSELERMSREDRQALLAQQAVTELLVAHSGLNVSAAMVAAAPELEPIAPVEVVGLWPAPAALAALDLRSDLESLLAGGGPWSYRALAGKAATGDNVETEILHGRRADILYIASHADEDGVYFSDQKYPSHLIAEWARELGASLVFLNACRTRDAAAAIHRKGIRAIVFITADIDDRAAIALARAFFRALAMGRDVNAAVNSARRSVVRSGVLDVEGHGLSIIDSFGSWSLDQDD